MSLGGEETRPGSARRPVRILLVDDSDDFRRQAARFLAAIPGCQVAALAASGEEAVELEKMIDPDLVLMDLGMPGIDGFEAARRIRARPGAGLVVIMTLDAAPFRRAVLERDLANGLVSKSQFGREFEYELERLFPPPDPREGQP